MTTIPKCFQPRLISLEAWLLTYSSGSLMLSKMLKCGYRRYEYGGRMWCKAMQVTSTVTRYSQPCGIYAVVSVATITVVKLVDIFAQVERKWGTLQSPEHCDGFANAKLLKYYPAYNVATQTHISMINFRLRKERRPNHLPQGQDWEDWWLAYDTELTGWVGVGVCVCARLRCVSLSRWPSRKLIASLGTLSCGNTIRNVRWTALISCIAALNLFLVSNNWCQHLLIFCILLLAEAQHKVHNLLLYWIFEILRSRRVSKVKRSHCPPTVQSLSRQSDLFLFVLFPPALSGLHQEKKKWASHNLLERCWQQSLKLKITAGEKRKKKSASSG